MHPDIIELTNSLLSRKDQSRRKISLLLFCTFVSFDIVPPEDIFFRSLVAVVAAKVNKYRKILLIVLRAAGTASVRHRNGNRYSVTCSNRPYYEKTEKSQIESNHAYERNRLADFRFPGSSTPALILSPLYAVKYLPKWY